MTSPLPEPFRQYRRVQRKYDAALAAELERVARQIRARINRLPVGVGGQVRRAQLVLVLRQIDRLLREMFTGPVADMIQAGRKAAVEAAQDAVETITAVAYTALPEAVADALVDGLDATAASGIESMFARVPRELSRRVYGNAARSSGAVHRLIRGGLASGLSAKELADSVYKYVSPSTPGGASYAAMRLARTEINNAFHERQLQAANRPGVTGVRWNLSSSHKVPDKCNVYAAAGIYDAEDVPDKPHPQCFCYLTYEVMNPQEFATALADGEFDDELDRRTKANLARLGVTPTESAPEKRTVPTNDNLWKSYRSGRKSEQELSGGAIAETTKVTFKDGSVGVQKVMFDPDPEDLEGLEPEELAQMTPAKDVQDAEELGSLVARAMGMRAPEVLRLNETTTIQQFMSGRVASSLPGVTLLDKKPLKRYARTDDGILMGLLDQVIGNADRNDGNWLVDGKQITPIDHGLAWHPIATKNKGRPVIGEDPFSESFFKFTRHDVEWRKIDVAPGDLIALRDIMETLRPEFKKRNQLSWLEWSLGQIDAMMPYATGTKRRIQ